MASLFNTLPQDTYSSLIKFIDNTGSAGPVKQLTDGAGTAFPLYLNSTTLSGSISASFATTSSYAVTASFALNAGSGGTVSTASLLTTASAALNVLTFTKGDGSTFNVTVNTGSGGTTNTGSLLTTASISLNTITFTKGDSSTFNITVNTGSATTVSTASLLTTASISTNILTFTKGDGSTFPVTIASSSYAVSSSYALSSSYATNAELSSTASNANGIYNAITNNTNDYVLTATGGTTINGEAQLRFNTSNGLIVSGSSTVITAQVAGTSNGGAYIGSVSSNESGLYDLAGDTPMSVFWDVSGYQYTQYNTIYSLATGKNGINTAYPTYSLDVNASSNTGVRIYSGSLAVGNIIPSATVGRIDASNDVVAFSTSDIRLKENITPILNPIAKIEAIGGYTFDWKPEHKDLHGFEGHDVGVIAQEIEVIMPELVTTRDNGYKAVKYEKLVPLLIEAIKDLQKQVDELKNK
jgi:hypothetical protein